MLKTLLFILLLFLVIRIASKYFLQKPNGKSSNVRFFYRTFKNVRDQQKKQQKQQQKNKDVKDRLDDIEEAEYEDVTEEEKDTSTS